MQKYFEFLCVSNTHKVEQKTLFTTAPNNMKYLGVNLTKDVKDLFIENYKIMLRDVKEDLNNMKNMPCS